MSRAQQEAEKDLNEELAKIHQYYAKHTSQCTQGVNCELKINDLILSRMEDILGWTYKQLGNCYEMGDYDAIDYYQRYSEEVYKTYLQYKK